MIENLEIAKPEPKNIKSFNLLEKYKNDLQYLENGKMLIERRMAEDGIEDATADKQLKRLTNSIETLRNLISNYELQGG